MHYACYYDKIEVAEYLLSKGANLDIQNNVFSIINSIFHSLFSFIF